jgi:hypothetical protein
MTVPPDASKGTCATPSTLGRSRSAGTEFAEAWGVLVRTLAFYPPTNDRVRQSLDQALQTFAAAQSDLGGEVSLLLSRRELLVGGVTTPLSSGSNLAWLAQRLERNGMAGVTFEPGLEPDALASFSLQLLEGYRRTQLDPEFERAAHDVPACVVPIEQRFEGSFRSGESEGDSSWLEALVAAHPAARTDPLALIAARDERVRSRIDGLLGTLETKPESEGRGPTVKAAELLTQLVHSLPAEATHREEDLIKLTVELLDALQVEMGRDQRTAAGDAFGAMIGDSPVALALANVCRRLFAREGLASEELAQRRIEGGAEPASAIAPWMRGHPLDERIADDLELLIKEVEALPQSDEQDMRLRSGLDPAEQLGVWLHYMTTLDSDEEANRTQPLAAACIRADPAAVREVLALYLRPLRASDEAEAQVRHRKRMLAFVREQGLTELLFEFEVFGDATIVDVFPRHFGPWLETLDLVHTKGRTRLLEVIAELGPERIHAAQAALEGPEGILAGARIQQLLLLPDLALGPLVRMALARANGEVKAGIVRFLRRAAAGQPEACLLDILEAGELPRDYLSELLEPSSEPQARARMRTRIADLLAERIEQWGSQANVAQRRLSAVRLLANFRSRHSEQVLKQIAKRTKLFQSAIDTDLQRAAREALRNYS